MKGLIVFQNRLSSIINIIGLSLALAACIMIFIWIDSESHFDDFHNDSDKIYRIMSYGQTYMVDGFPVSPGRIGVLGKERIPEIELQTRIYSIPECVFNKDQNIIVSKEGIFADQDFFRIFNFPIIDGNAETMLDNPRSIIMTARFSEKVFGTPDALGESVLIDGNDFIVTGILEDLPVNSHLKFEFVASMENIKNVSYHWGSFSFNTYLKLSDAGNIDLIGEKLTEIALEHNCPQVKEDGLVFRLQALDDIYLDTPVRAGFPYYRSGSRKLLNSFLLVAVIILVMASINFVNLSVATSSSRNTELGVKKTFGARRRELTAQLVIESGIKVLMATIIALFIAIALKPLLEEVSGKVIEIRATAMFVFYITAVFIFTVLLSALYPGLVISGRTPGIIFNKEYHNKTGVRLFNPRSILLFIQTVMSAILIFVSVFLVKQMYFIRHKDLGFTPENVLCVPLRSGSKATYPIIKEKLLRNPSINYVSCSDYLWATVNDRCGGCIQWEGKDPEYNPDIRKAVVGYNYFNALQVPVVEGRSFSESFPSDARQAFMINESAKKLFGIDNVIGLNIVQSGLKGVEQEGEVIGVFSDFNYKSLKEPVQPMVVRLMDDAKASERAGMLYVSSSGNDSGQVFQGLLDAWNEINPEIPFECYYLNQVYSDQYSFERRNYLLLNIFTVVAITISLLGLIGMISFLNQARTKEICIRKVLGGSVEGILQMQVFSVLYIVGTSIIVAIPLSLVIIRKMYSGFAYTARINGFIYLFISLLIIILMATLVTAQSLRSAGINPASGLRSE